MRLLNEQNRESAEIVGNQVNAALLSTIPSPCFMIIFGAAFLFWQVQQDSACILVLYRSVMEANRVLLREYRLTMRFHLLPVLPVLYTL